MTVLCDDGRLKLQLSEGCPHTLLLPSLEQLLLSSRSLPVLLQARGLSLSLTHAHTHTHNTGDASY